MPVIQAAGVSVPPQYSHTTVWPLLFMWGCSPLLLEEVSGPPCILYSLPAPYLSPEYNNTLPSYVENFGFTKANHPQLPSHATPQPQPPLKSDRCP